MPAAGYEHVAGHRFPGGQATVPPWMNHLWCESVESPNTAPYVHPVLVYYAAVEGSGIKFQDIFDLLEADAGSGILYAEQELEFERPIEIDRVYRSEGGIDHVERKHGRRAGTFDLVRFAIRLHDDQGLAATSTSTFVFPRPEVQQ